MNSPSLTATYTGLTVPEDRWWVRLEQLPVSDDVATVTETAAFLDAAFDINPCEPETSTATEETGVEKVTESAGDAFDFAICSQEPDGSVEIQVKVIRSHQTEPYRLHVAGGSIVSTLVVPEELRRADTVESAASLELDYPVIGAFSCSWQNDLVTASSSRPEIRRNGNTLYWSEAATGTIGSSYLTTYDLVTIRVDGIDGEQGGATLRVVFHALAEDLVPELPKPADFDHSLCPRYRWRFRDNEDVVTCYKEIALTTRCSCSQEEIGYRTYDQVVPCPEWVEECPGNLNECMVLLGTEAATEYVECAGDNEIPGSPGMVYSVSRAGYYEAVCCKKPTVTLPDCLEKKTSYPGGHPIVLGEAVYRNLYGPATRFVPVPAKGGVCGQHITRQIVLSGNCCEGVAPLGWDTALSPEVISPNSAVMIGVSGGGIYPYEWTVSGEGFQFQAGGSRRIITSVPFATLSALPTACGLAQITVTDGCSTVHADIRCTAGRWIQVAQYYVTEAIDPSSRGLFQCSSTGPPYVSGEYSSILQGRWWVGPVTLAPPTVAALTYFRQSTIGGLWASNLPPGVLMLAAPGTNGEVLYPALEGKGPGYCVLPEGGTATDVTLYWDAGAAATYEWGC